jgi:hypothetical protein
VENRGQTDTRVRFVAQRQGAAFFLTPDEIVLKLVRTSGASDIFMKAAASREPVSNGVALGLRFLGSNPHFYPGQQWILSSKNPGRRG